MNKKIEATALNGKQLLKNGDEMSIRMGSSDMRMKQMTVNMYRADWLGRKCRNLAMTMVILTLLLLTGLPGQADAATVNYYVTPGTVTNVAGAPTAHTSCTDPTSSYSDLLTTSIGNMCTNAYRWQQGSPGLHSKAYFNTAYTVATTVTGTSYQVTMRDGGQVGFQLFYVNAAGNETLFGNEVSIQQADGQTNNYTVDLSAQSATVPAGSKLGLRTWGYDTNPDFRMYIGNPDGRTGSISGHLIVDEAAGGGGDTTAPTVTAFTLPATSASPISVTSFTASDDTSVTGYMITESASAPAAGAAGWTGSAPTTITTASIGSITFYAWAKDAAGNVSASQNATVNVTGGGGGGSFEQIDDFSTGWGNWVNVTGDQRDWTRQTGTTASSNTGPTANSGADQGGDGWYVYTETSSPTVTGDQYYLESNDLDAGTYNLNISFYWNMYGADMGSLHLDVWNGSSWDLSIWSRSGNNGDAWVQQDIDLAAAGYTSGTIKLRFRGIKGLDWASDMALDTIRIYGDAAGGPDSLVVTSNTPLANSAVEGNTDVQMQRLQVDCTAGGADDGICEITGITVDDLAAVTGTEIDNLKIYIDTDTSFAGTEQNVADASFAGTSKAIDLTSIALDLRQVSAGTPKYIWVTYDLAFDAAPAAVQTSVTTVAVNTGSGDTGATGTWNSNNFGITAADGMNCASCHAYPPLDGARGGAGGAVVGDHQTPAHLAATCDVCHVVPATETSADAGHRNGIIQMKDGTIGDAASGDNGSYSKGATFAQSNNPTTGTCSNVDCHFNMVTPQWGVGTLDHTVALGAGDLSNGTSCSACHDDNSGGLASWTDIYVEHLSDCATCHNSARGEVITAISTGADPTNCLDCHSDKTVAHGSPDHSGNNLVTLASQCASCHNPGSAANATVDVTHSGNCNLCHTASIPALQSGLSAGTCVTCHGSDVETFHPSCTTCHGEPPNGSSSPNTSGAHSAHDLLGFGSVAPSCNACHNGASHDGNSTQVSILSSFDDKSTGTPSFNGSTCSNTSCHGGQTTPSWSTGTLDVDAQCTSCHASGTAEYNSYNSGEHNKHMNSYNADCIDCHSRSKLAVGSGGNTHFSNLQTTTFEQVPASTIGGSGTRVTSWGGVWQKSNCSTNCH